MISSLDEFKNVQTGPSESESAADLICSITSSCAKSVPTLFVGTVEQDLNKFKGDGDVTTKAVGQGPPVFHPNLREKDNKTLQLSKGDCKQHNNVN